MNISAKARPADLLGLTADEYDRAAALLERPPSHAELGIIAAMWSEHCAYKSTRRWLKTLPTEAPWVVQGPGENAGAVEPPCPRRTPGARWARASPSRCRCAA